MMPTESEAFDMGRLRWRCRRGLKELDVLLIPFLETDYADLTPALRIDFAALVEEEDVDLLDWLVHGLPAPAAYAALLNILLQRPLHL